MDVMIWLGAILMGLSLGLLGSGGSILTVPLLVFLAKEPEKVAIAESLLIVGAVACVGALRAHLSGHANLKLALLFGLPSMAGAYFGAWASQFVSGEVQLVIFSIVMLAASGFMLKPLKTSILQQPAHVHPIKLIVASLPVGALAGLVGVGGGFLIVPALLIVARISMQQAVGTSLMIIVLQSISGFYKHHQLFEASALSLNWNTILTVGGCAIAGVLAGGKLADRLPQQQIKRVFGVLLIGLALFTLYSAVV